MTTSARQTIPRVDATLALKFDCDSAETRLRVLQQEPPLRVVRGFQAGDGASLVHLHNVSGGVLGGDRLTLCAEVGAGAEAQLTTPGATRIYRHREGWPDAEQINQFEVATGGVLEYVPDPLIPFARARFHQQTRVRLAAGATYIGWDTIAPGREAHNETFAYERVALATDIEGPHGPLALERAELEPAKRPLTSPLRLGNYRYFTTFYVLHLGRDATFWHALERDLQELALAKSQPPTTVWGVSALPSDGLVVRGLSQLGRDLEAGLVDFWRASKRSILGREPHLPRKQY